MYKDTVEAAVAAVRIIADACIRSKTVKRLIYTASIMSSSPLTEDGVCFKSCIDETCWTPFDVSFTYANDFTMVFPSHISQQCPRIPLNVMICWKMVFANVREVIFFGHGFCPVASATGHKPNPFF